MGVLADRYGLTDRTVREFELGLMERQSGPWVTIPVRDGQGKLINVKSRYIGRSPKINDAIKYLNWRGHGAAALYPAHRLPPPGSRVLIVCGMFDAIVGRQYGWDTVTSTAGVNVPWPPDWEDIAEHWDVTVLFDRGEEPWADRLAAQLGCRAVHLPAGLPPGTDLADMFTQHGWARWDLIGLLDWEEP